MLNKKTDNYVVAQWLLKNDLLTERQALMELGVKNISARVSELKQMGLPVESILKKVVKRNGKAVKVIDYFQIKNKCKGKYTKNFKGLTK